MESDLLTDTNSFNLPDTKNYLNHHFYYDKTKIKLQYPVSPIKKYRPTLIDAADQYTTLPFQSDPIQPANVKMTNLATKCSKKNKFIIAPDGLIPNSKLRAIYPKYKQIESEKLKSNKVFNEGDHELIEHILNKHLFDYKPKSKIKPSKKPIKSEVKLDKELEKNIQIDVVDRLNVEYQNTYTEDNAQVSFSRKNLKSQLILNKIKAEMQQQKLPKEETNLPRKSHSLMKVKLAHSFRLHRKEKDNILNEIEKELAGGGTTNTTVLRRLKKDRTLTMNAEEFEKWFKVLLEVYKIPKKIYEQIKEVLLDNQTARNELQKIFTNRNDRVGFINTITDSEHFIEYMLQFYDDDLSALLDDIDDVILNDRKDKEGKLLQHCGNNYILQSFITDYLEARELGLLYLVKSFPNRSERFLMFHECLRKGPVKAVIKYGFQNKRKIASKFFKAILRCDYEEIKRIIGLFSQRSSITLEENLSSAPNKDQVPTLPPLPIYNENSWKLLTAKYLAQMIASILPNYDSKLTSSPENEKEIVLQSILAEVNEFHSEIIQYLKLFLLNDSEAAEKLLEGIINDDELAIDGLIELIGTKPTIDLIKSLKLFEIKVTEQIYANSSLKVDEIDEVKVHLKSLQHSLEKNIDKYKAKEEKDAKFHIRDLTENDKERITAFQKKLTLFHHDHEDLVSDKTNSIKTADIKQMYEMATESSKLYPEKEKMETKFVKFGDQNVLITYHSIPVHDEANAKAFQKQVSTQHSSIISRKNLSFRNMGQVKEISKPRKIKPKIQLKTSYRPSSSIRKASRPMSVPNIPLKVDVKVPDKLLSTIKMATSAYQLVADNMMVNLIKIIYDHLVDLLQDDSDFEAIDKDFNSLVFDIFKKSPSFTDNISEKYLLHTIELLNADKNEETIPLKKDPSAKEQSLNRKLENLQSPDANFDVKEKLTEKKAQLRQSIVKYWKLQVFSHFLKTIDQDKANKMLEKFKQKEDDMSKFLDETLKETIYEQLPEETFKKSVNWRNDQFIETHPFYSTRQSFIDNILDMFRRDKMKIDFDEKHREYIEILEVIRRTEDENKEIFLKWCKIRNETNQINDDQTPFLTVIPDSKLERKWSMHADIKLPESTPSPMKRDNEPFILSAPDIPIDNVASAIPTPGICDKIQETQDLLKFSSHQRYSKTLHKTQKTKLSHLHHKPTNPVKDFQLIYGAGSYFLPYLTPDNKKSQFMGNYAKYKSRFLTYETGLKSKASCVYKSIHKMVQESGRAELPSLLRHACFVQRPSDIPAGDWAKIGKSGMARNMLIHAPNHFRNCDKLYREFEKYGISGNKMGQRQRLFTFITQAQHISVYGQTNKTFIENDTAQTMSSSSLVTIN